MATFRTNAPLTTVNDVTDNLVVNITPVSRNSERILLRFGESATFGVVFVEVIGSGFGPPEGGVINEYRLLNDEGVIYELTGISAEISKFFTDLGIGGNELAFAPELAGDDVFTGSDGGDNIRTFGGADLIESGAGDDFILAEGGDDSVEAGPGDDTVNGGDEDDVIFGGDGDDEIAGDAGADLIRGQQGNDVITGGDGNDTLTGNKGDDNVKGFAGDDTVKGGPGADTVKGNKGDDKLIGQGGDDRVFGGPGDDTLAGQGGDDRLIGQSGADLIKGGNGDDTLIGRSGDDVYEGGAGRDVFIFRDNDGANAIRDFENGVDVINFKRGIGGVDDLVFTQGAVGVVISFEGGSVRLNDQTIGDIDGSDFLFG